MNDPDEELKKIANDEPITAEEALMRLQAEISSGESSGIIGRMSGEEAKKFFLSTFAEGEEVPEDLLELFEPNPEADAIVKAIEDAIEQYTAEQHAFKEAIAALEDVASDSPPEIKAVLQSMIEGFNQELARMDSQLLAAKNELQRQLYIRKLGK